MSEDQVPFWVKQYVVGSTDEHWVIGDDGWDCTHEFMQKANPRIARVHVSQNGVMTWYGNPLPVLPVRSPFDTPTQ